MAVLQAAAAARLTTNTNVAAVNSSFKITYCDTPRRQLCNSCLYSQNTPPSRGEACAAALCISHFGCTTPVKISCSVTVHPSVSVPYFEYDHRGRKLKGKKWSAISVLACSLAGICAAVESVHQRRRENRYYYRHACQSACGFAHAPLQLPPGTAPSV